MHQIRFPLGSAPHRTGELKGGEVGGGWGRKGNLGETRWRKEFGLPKNFGMVPPTTHDNTNDCIADDGRMSMDDAASASDSCQLMTRTWIITDEDGREQKVDGPGVVGKSCYKCVD